MCYLCVRANGWERKSGRVQSVFKPIKHALIIENGEGIHLFCVIDTFSFDRAKGNLLYAIKEKCDLIQWNCLMYNKNILMNHHS